MKIALLFAVVSLLSGHQDVPTTTFTEPFVGFQFKYPKTWTIVKSTKKKDSARSTFSIPVDGSSSKAELDVDRTEFHASADLWQTIQLRANEQLHRQVVRQWSQEVLGVSMLFTRIDYTDQGTPMSAVSALYFTRTSQKMLLRLSSRTSDFDKVFFELSHILETLKQIDGNLPEEDDPTKELASAPKKPELAPTSFHAIDSPARHKKPELKAPVTVEVVVSTKKMIVRLPLEWVGDHVKDNTLEVSAPTLNKNLHFELFSLLDSEPGLTALTKLSAAKLDSFTKVTSRVDTGPANNQAGCSVATVWRIGQNAAGNLTTCEAMGTMGGYYFLMTYEQTDSLLGKADRKLIEGLLKQISIELVP